MWHCFNLLSSILNTLYQSLHSVFMLYTMNLLFFIISYFTSVTVAIQTLPEEDFYYAAVVEYSPIGGSDGNDILRKNVNKYVQIIGVAAESADIVVFPELGLNFDDNSVYIDIPFGNKTVPPADNSTAHPVLKELSKAARDNKVYVSFTIHEKYSSSHDGILRYNTNVVFNRKGEIVARYRKYNLFNEYYLNVTSVPEVAFFDSDFGVRFGMFICFDIMFKDPALKLIYDKNITDIIFPSWWFSELPSLLSIQMQFAWAYMTDANLLAAGINSIQRSSTGSGIYAGKKGPLVYVFSETNQTQILTAKLYKKGKVGKTEEKKLNQSVALDSDLQLWNEDLQFYDTLLLTDLTKNGGVGHDKEHSLISTQILNQTLCQDKFCCEFFINMTFTYLPQIYLNMSDVSYMKNDSFYHYQYRLAAFNGVRGFYGATSTGIEVCAIIPCLNDTLSSCGKKSGNTFPLMIDSATHGQIFLSSTSFNSISVRAISKEQMDFTFPNILESSNSKSSKAFGSLPDTSKINFHTDYQISKLTFASNRLIYAGIYSRIISRDGEEIPISSGNKFSYTFVSIFVAIYVIYVLKKY